MTRISQEIRQLPLETRRAVQHLLNRGPNIRPILDTASQLCKTKNWRYPYEGDDRLYPWQNADGDTIIDWGNRSINVNDLMAIAGTLGAMHTHGRVDEPPREHTGIHANYRPRCIDGITSTQRRTDHIAGVLIAKYEVEEHIHRKNVRIARYNEHHGENRGAMSVAFNLAHLALELSMKLRAKRPTRTHSLVELSRTGDMDYPLAAYTSSVQEMTDYMEQKKNEIPSEYYTPVYNSIRECKSIPTLLERADNTRELLYSYTPERRDIPFVAISMGQKVCVGTRRDSIISDLLPMGAVDTLATGLARTLMSQVTWARLRASFMRYAEVDPDRTACSTPAP